MKRQKADKKQRKTHKLLEKNRDKDLSKSIVKADSYCVLCLRDYFRDSGVDRHTTKIRLSEAFDREFTLNGCNEVISLNMDYPYLGFMILTAYSARHFAALAPTARKTTRRINRCIRYFFTLLGKYETVAVNAEVVSTIDNFFRNRIAQREFVTSFLAITMPDDQKINTNSMLMARAPYVCVAYSCYGRCDHRGEGKPACGGRHICLEKQCATPRGHSTPFCTENTASLSTGCLYRVQNNIKHAGRKRPRNPRENRDTRRDNRTGSKADKADALVIKLEKQLVAAKKRKNQQ